MSLSTLAFATIEEIKQKIASKKVSKEEVLDFFLRRIASHDQHIDSLLSVYEKDRILADTNQEGQLEGIPGVIKANICQKNREISCASKMLQDVTSPYDATVCKRLKHEGAFLVGLANMDEFAMGSSTETSAFKKTKNPWALDRVPGGSSGGSAAAVSAGLVPWSLGSDTGGSIRQPAAFCGIVGIKPTYGLVSRYGLVAYGSSLDQIGVFSRTVKDNALVFSQIAGHDMRDSSSLFVEKKNYAERLVGELPEGLRIGVIENALTADGMDSEIASHVEGAVEQLQKLGAHAKRIALPTLDYAAAAYFIVSRAEAASNLARFDGIRYGMRSKDAKTLDEVYAKTRHDGFGKEVKTRIMVGNYVLSSGHAGEYYENAKIVQRLIRRDFLEAFRDVDVLIMPTHPVPAFKFGAYDVDKLQMDLQDYFTCPMNLAGIPALSLPCGFTKNKLPIGFQIVGPHLSEQLLYKVGHAYESATQWYKETPNN